LDKKLKKEDELAQLRIDVKEKYKLYYKYNKRLATLADTEIQANKSNAFIRELVSLQALFFNKYPKEDSCIKLLFKKSDASLSESNMKRFQSFCDKVDEIEKIRNLKKEVIKKFERYRIQDDNKISLKDTPNEYTDEFLSFLGKHIKYQEEDFENEIKLLFLDEYKEHEISQTPIDILNNFLKFKIPKTKKKSSKRELSLRKILIYSISSIFIVFSIFSFFIIREYNHRKQEDKKLAKENKIIENAKLIKATRTPQLISLYEAINKELKDDYNNDKIRNLSPELIGRIVSLSEQMKPYLFLNNQKIIQNPLSPERAGLFTTLFKNNLDTNTFYEIYTKGNFTYSDFSGLDLTGLNLMKNLYGAEGGFKKELQVLVTPYKRINLSNSSFRNSNLTNTTLYGDLKDCDFRDAIFYNTTFNWSDITNSIFQETVLKEIAFKNSNLKDTNFKNVTMRGTSRYDTGFVNCDLRGAVFDNSTIGSDYEPFLFENCFLASKGTFFRYSIHIDPYRTSIYGFPFVEELNQGEKAESTIIKYGGFEDGHHGEKVTVTSLSITKEGDSLWLPREVNTRKELPFIPIINKPFKLIESKSYDEKEFGSLLGDYDERDPLNKKIYTYIVRTNDNYNRGTKVIRDFDNFYNLKKWIRHGLDTLTIHSSLNLLQSKYRGVVYNHVQDTSKQSRGIASFKACDFTNTHFKNSSMENISFEKAIFQKRTDKISNQFIDVRLSKNNFDIASGVFLFSKETTYDSILINDKFPLFDFIERKDSLIYYYRIDHKAVKNWIDESSNTSNSYLLN